MPDMISVGLFIAAVKDNSNIIPIKKVLSQELLRTSCGDA